MGLFKSKEEKEQKKEAREQKKEARAIYLGDSLQPIGKIPINGTCGLTLKPAEKVLNIHHEKTDITLPYERIKGFKVENETTLGKAGSGIGGAIVGGALFGGAGAIVGQNLKKGATKIKWVATLIYEDKEGATQELHFVERGITGLYDGNTKSNIAAMFESVINNVASKHGEEITEL